MLVPPVALEHVSGRASLGPEGAVLLMAFVIDTGYKPHGKGGDSWRCQSHVYMSACKGKGSGSSRVVFYGIKTSAPFGLSLY